MAPPRLSKDRILAAALEIADAEGLDALSMRRLAQALDVWPMTIYGHFEDKDALLDAMAAQSAGRVRRPRKGDSWRAQLKTLLREAQAGLAASAEIGNRLPRAFLTAEPLALSDAGVAILRNAGFSTADAARAWRALWSYTFGFATFRLAATGEEAGRRMRAAIAALPEPDYPALAGAADDLAAAFSDDAEFDFGVERLLDGLAARLSPAA
jgi:TetR/AcrR family transcriptional regulator, tetracycline repressor protein